MNGLALGLQVSSTVPDLFFIYVLSKISIKSSTGISMTFLIFRHLFW